MSQEIIKKSRLPPMTAKEAEVERKRRKVPNWQSLDEYKPKYGAKWHKDELRWEFLRRTKEYREGWDAREELLPYKYGMAKWKDPADSTFPCFLRDGEIIEKFAIESGIDYQEAYLVASAISPLYPIVTIAINPELP